jgi:PhnB protein
MADKQTAQTVIVPTLSVRMGKEAIAFYQKAFAAEVLMCMEGENETVLAEMSVNGARFFLADESPEHGNFSPESLGGISVRMGLFVSDPDLLVNNAIEAGAILVAPVEDQDYGYRIGRIIDPFGHHWEIARKLS